MLLVTTAGALRAILCFVDPNNTPKIAYDKDEYAKSLGDHIKQAIGNKDGSEAIRLSFGNKTEYDRELLRQFNGVCQQIEKVFGKIVFCTRVLD